MKKWIQTLDYKVKRGNVVLNIGDYIDYHDHAGENGKDIYNGKWQVLGVDDKGRCLIVSEKNVANHYFNQEKTLEGGQKAYSEGVKILDKICKVYARGKDALNSRSIRIEDIDKLTGYDKNNYFGYGKKCNYNNKEGVNFIWHNGKKWNNSKTKETVSLIQSYYSYKGDLNCNSKVYNMLFENRYWLGSTYVNLYSEFACFGLHYVYGNNIFGYGFVYSNGDNNDNDLGVRAVVTLKNV